MFLFGNEIEKESQRAREPENQREKKRRKEMEKMVKGHPSGPPVVLLPIANSFSFSHFLFFDILSLFSLFVSVCVCVVVVGWLSFLSTI